MKIIFIIFKDRKNLTYLKEQTKEDKYKDASKTYKTVTEKLLIYNYFCTYIDNTVPIIKLNMHESHIHSTNTFNV